MVNKEIYTKETALAVIKNAIENNVEVNFVDYRQFTFLYRYETITSNKIYIRVGGHLDIHAKYEAIEKIQKLIEYELIEEEEKFKLHDNNTTIEIDYTY